MLFRFCPKTLFVNSEFNQEILAPTHGRVELLIYWLWMVVPQFVSEVGANNSHFTMVYGRYNYSFHGVNLNQQTSLGGTIL